MDSLVISLVDCSNGQKVALISESRGDLGFDVRISNGSTMYRFDNLVGYESRPPNRTREARETYMAALQGAFQPSTNANDQNPKSSFTYDATLSGDVLSLVVKQRLPGESHYLLLHKAEYKSVPNSAQELLSLLENVNAILAPKDEEVNYIREDSQYFKDSMDTLQSDRDNFAVWKESLQDRLIRGFCCVLYSEKGQTNRRGPHTRLHDHPGGCCDGHRCRSATYHRSIGNGSGWQYVISGATSPQEIEGVEVPRGGRQRRRLKHSESLPSDWVTLYLVGFDNYSSVDRVSHWQRISSV